MYTIKTTVVNAGEFKYKTTFNLNKFSYQLIIFQILSLLYDRSCPSVWWVMTGAPVIAGQSFVQVHKILYLKIWLDYLYGWVDFTVRTRHILGFGDTNWENRFFSIGKKLYERNINYFYIILLYKMKEDKSESPLRWNSLSII